MTAISLRLPENLVSEIDDYAQKLHLSRTAYIRIAIKNYNLELAQKEHREHLMQLSRKVRAASSRVNKEFSEIEHDPED